MLRKTALAFYAPWIPPRLGDTKLTVPPPPCGDLGGPQGVSVPYSPRIAKTSHAKRMARSTYAERIKENATYYPFVGVNSTEYSIQYLPRPYKDSLTNRPLLEIGEGLSKLPRRVPVIFLKNIFKKKEGAYLGKKFETVYVNSDLARTSLIPRRYCVYATPEAYELLGLPVIDHQINAVIAKNSSDLRLEVERRMWNEERWKYSVDYLFRSYEKGPIELRDVEEEWDGNEELGGGAGTAGVGGAGRTGPLRVRKARKIKLF